MRKKKINQFEQLSISVTQWMGSSQSLVIHTLIFVVCFLLILIGLNASTVMLVVTTAVSLEAIYLSLFIQMTVNRQAKSISKVEKDIDEIQEDVDEMQEDDEEEDQTNRLITQIHKQLKDIDKKVNSLNK